jgi:hypothetical protein
MAGADGGGLGAKNDMSPPKYQREARMVEPRAANV